MGILGDLLPVERLRFASDLVCIGEIRCRPDHPLFPGSPLSNGHCVAFPRSVLWVQHAGGPRGVEDPSVAGLYNRGEPYKRWPIAPDGDCADWLAFSSETIAEAMAATGRRAPARTLDERPFHLACVPIDGALYLTQRRFFLQLAREEKHKVLDVEERSLQLLHRVMQSAHGARSDSGEAAVASRSAAAPADVHETRRRQRAPVLGELAGRGQDVGGGVRRRLHEAALTRGSQRSFSIWLSASFSSSSRSAAPAIFSRCRFR